MPWSFLYQPILEDMVLFKETQCNFSTGGQIHEIIDWEHMDDFMKYANRIHTCWNLQNSIMLVSSRCRPLDWINMCPWMNLGCEWKHAINCNLELGSMKCPFCWAQDKASTKTSLTHLVSWPEAWFTLRFEKLGFCSKRHNAILALGGQIHEILP